MLARQRARAVLCFMRVFEQSALVFSDFGIGVAPNRLPRWKGCQGLAPDTPFWSPKRTATKGGVAYSRLSGDSLGSPQNSEISG